MSTPPAELSPGSSSTVCEDLPCLGCSLCIACLIYLSFAWKAVAEQSLPGRLLARDCVGVCLCPVVHPQSPQPAHRRRSMHMPVKVYLHERHSHAAVCWRKGNLRPPTSCPQGQLALWIPELSAGSGRCRNRSAQKGSCSFHPKRKGSGGQGFREEAGGQRETEGGAEEGEPGVLGQLGCSPAHSSPKFQAGVMGRGSQHPLFPDKAPAGKYSKWSWNVTEGMTSKAVT